MLLRVIDKVPVPARCDQCAKWSDPSPLDGGFGRCRGLTSEPGRQGDAAVLGADFGGVTLRTRGNFGCALFEPQPDGPQADGPRAA